jgi:hypothetical protein
MKYRGQAKVEYLANKSEIDELLNGGHSGQFVYSKLVKEDKITMSLPRFYELVRGTAKRPRSGGKNSLARTSLVPVPDSSQFFYDKNKEVL